MSVIIHPTTSPSPSPEQIEEKKDNSESGPYDNNDSYKTKKSIKFNTKTSDQQEKKKC